MNDFDYDVMQKKRLAHNKFRNAKYKHGGCRLPHEDLTPAQIKRRNGPMMTYNLNLPMSWDIFKTMPKDLQQQYLDGLHARFGVGPSDLAKYLFLRTPSNLHTSTRALGLTVAKCDKHRDIDGFLAWLRKADEEDRKTLQGRGKTAKLSRDEMESLPQMEAAAKEHTPPRRRADDAYPLGRQPDGAGDGPADAPCAVSHRRASRPRDAERVLR